MMKKIQLMKLTKKELVTKIIELEQSNRYFQTRIKDCDEQDKIYNNLFDKYEKKEKELKKIEVENSWLWKRVSIMERTISSLAITRVKEIIAADFENFIKKESKTQTYKVQWKEDQ
jgi:hypothetical protein